MRRLFTLTLALLAIAALTIPWQHGPLRLARKLTRRSPQPGESARVTDPAWLERRERPTVVRQLLEALETTKGPVILYYSPFARRDEVEPAPPLGRTLDGLAAFIVHTDHREAITRQANLGQLPDRLRVY